MVVSTALLVRERGARATSIDDVLAHSGAPRGSVYHHFPGGRRQLLREAIDYAGEFVAARIETRRRARSTMLDMLHAGLPRATRAAATFAPAARSSRSPSRPAIPKADLHEHAGAAFGRWQELLERAARSRGSGTSRAGELAVLVIASIEGAIVMARARRDAEPLDNVHRQLRTLLRAEINEGSPE